MTDTLVGTRLDEYRLENLLGQGGMARVYRGLDTGLQRYAAIKVIDTPYQQDESYMTRFEREARAIAQLDHPHIVSVYRYGQVENLLYLAMKYIEGADLHAVLSSYEQDGQFMAFDEVTRLIREIGSALDYAHSQGVVHRDIKPSNVMLDDQGRAYITDFGLALLADVGTRGEILGSPHYIAPEQAVSSAGAVPQSDLYALGVILFRMVTGQLPFTDDDVLELLMLHMTAVPPNPQDLRPDINPAVAEVILKALAKEPDDRYASGEALADALEAALKETAVIPAAAPTLTVMDRVALDMEALPPIPAAATPQITKPQPTTPVSPAVEASGSPTATTETPGSQEGALTHSNLPVPLKGVGIGVVLLLILLAAFLLLRNRDDTGALVADAASTVTTEAIIAETAMPEQADTALLGEAPTKPDETPIVVAITDGNDPGDSNSASEPEAVPQTTGTLYLPVISSDEEQSAPIAAATATTTLLPPVTESPAPTATAAPPTDTPSPTVYQLLLVTNKEDSLFVVNQSGESFPLNALRLGKGKKTIQGTEWAIGQLAPGSCVTAWKDSGNPKPPDVDCNEVGTQLTREGSDRFWKGKFDIFYNDEKIGTCDPKKDCLIEITP